MKKLLTLLSIYIVLTGFMLYSGDGGLTKSKLTDYNVYSQEDHVKLTWSTKSRKDIAHFFIERSRDKKTFESYRKVPDDGDSPKQMEFFEIDSQPLPGWSYYRIKEVMTNGDYAYSAIAPVFFGLDRLSKGSFIAAKSPNDPPEKLSVTSFAGEPALLVLRGKTGKEFYLNDALQVSGGELVVTAGPQIPAGVYIITASSIDDLLGLKITAK